MGKRNIFPTRKKSISLICPKCGKVLDKWTIESHVELVSNRFAIEPEISYNYHTILLECKSDLHELASVNPIIINSKLADVVTMLIRKNYKVLSGILAAGLSESEINIYNSYGSTMMMMDLASFINRSKYWSVNNNYTLAPSTAMITIGYNNKDEDIPKYAIEDLERIVNDLPTIEELPDKSRFAYY